MPAYEIQSSISDGARALDVLFHDGTSDLDSIEDVISAIFCS